ncbi:MAG: GYD domain-containing protein [Chloroflexi bacterium]|nr:GYD domain-containing protein [Chloroflexota bacterium]
MATYFMFGKYSMDAVGKISAGRTEKGAAIIGDCGGEAKAAYVLLGDVDLVLIADFPSTEAAMKASVALSKEMGIGFTTAPAISVEEFDKLIPGG